VFVNKIGADDFGFLLSTSRSTAKKKDREKECAVDLMDVLERMDPIKANSWCYTPASEPKAELDLAKLTELAHKKVEKSTLTITEPLPHVLVSAMSFGPNDGKHGADPELMVLDRFDAGFGELFKEARRVSGLVRKQWFVSVITMKNDGDSEGKGFPIGIGMATDSALAKKRAMQSAESRLNALNKRILTNALKKGPVPSDAAKK
jgi:hypothetical protein